MGCTTSTGSTPLPEDAYMRSSSIDNGCPMVKLETRRFSDDNFTHHHKKLLLESWELLDKDNQGRGIRIFLRIFELRPEAQDAFPFRNLEGNDLISNPLFRQHALRFMNGIDTTLQNIDALEVAVIPLLSELGRKHCTISGFSASHLLVFLEAILYIVEKDLGDQCTEPVRQSWQLLLKFIGDSISHGYQKGLTKSEAVNGDECIKGCTMKTHDYEKDMAPNEALDNEHYSTVSQIDSAKVVISTVNSGSVNTDVNVNGSSKCPANTFAMVQPCTDVNGLSGHGTRANHQEIHESCDVAKGNNGEIQHVIGMQYAVKHSDEINAVDHEVCDKLDGLQNDGNRI